MCLLDYPKGILGREPLLKYEFVQPLVFGWKMKSPIC